LDTGDAADARDDPVGDAALAGAFAARDGACTDVPAACAELGIHSAAQSTNAAAARHSRSRDRRAGRLCVELAADDMAAA